MAMDQHVAVGPGMHALAELQHLDDVLRACRPRSRDIRPRRRRSGSARGRSRRYSSRAGGRGSWVSMIDSTWLTPTEQCSDSSGMPQIVTLWVGRGMSGRFYSRLLAICRPTANRPIRKIRRNVSAETAWRAFWPSHTPTKVGAMAATPPDEIGRGEGALDGERGGQRAHDEDEHDAQRLHEFVPVDVERLHVGQERHGGDAGDAGRRAAGHTDQRIGPALGGARHRRPPRASTPDRNRSPG